LNGLAKAAARPHFDPAALATPDPLLLNVDVDRIIDCRDRITEVGDAAEDRTVRSKTRVLSLRPDGAPGLVSRQLLREAVNLGILRVVH
jgi:hypothetical protein